VGVRKHSLSYKKKPPEHSGGFFSLQGLHFLTTHKKPRLITGALQAQNRNYNFRGRLTPVFFSQDWKTEAGYWIGY
jgi:hypothetical protein